jgi:hypothetical protein
VRPNTLLDPTVKHRPGRSPAGIDGRGENHP